MTMETFAPLPISMAELERYLLQARRQWRPNQTGGHITRRRGQSLEFREFSRYSFGDDIRHVDWRASARSGTRRWLVRKFTSEDNFKLVVSIDNRESMILPRAKAQRRRDVLANVSKLQMARWLAESIAHMGLQSDDSVVLHRLFGEAGTFFPLRGSRGIEQIVSGLDQISAEIDTTEIPNLSGLDRHLPPASVWIIISDFYFDHDKANLLAERIAAAQNGMRWVMLIDLDSWSFERAIFNSGPRLWRINGPWSAEKKFDNAQIDAVQTRIQQHKNEFLAQCQGSADYVRWEWLPDVNLALGNTFAKHFAQLLHDDPIIRRLYERDAWS